MKFNNKELADLSLGEATIEGRLHHKKSNSGYSHTAYKEKWFKLRANILYYFNLSDTGQIFEKKPVGAFVLENVIVQYDMNSAAPFSFSIYFKDEIEKKHLFCGRTEEVVNKWVEALKQASYEYWRSQLMLLQEKLRLITGQDPLLMYPKNEGCKPVFTEVTTISHKTNKKIVVQNSKSQFYATEEEDFEQHGKKSDTMSMSNITIQNNIIGNDDVKVKSISEAPPVRPERGNKVKPEVKCANLIEL